MTKAVVHIHPYDMYGLSTESGFLPQGTGEYIQITVEAQDEKYTIFTEVFVIGECRYVADTAVKVRTKSGMDLMPQPKV